MRLSVDNGTELKQLTGDIQLTFEEMLSSAVDTTVSIEPDWESAFNNALQAADNYRPIAKINGIAPTDAGDFSIEGSECDSWDYITGGISLVDLCPSCKTCETIYKLQYETENLRLWINTLKDVNLLLSTEPPYYEGAQPAMTVFLDNNNLSSYRVTGATHFDAVGGGVITSTKEPHFDLCMPSGSVPDDDFMRLRGLELLKQYITTVHMWNYVVSQNNSSTEIQIAPEDTAGFVVQTKRALPSCSGDQTIQCVIEVDLLTDEHGNPYVYKDSESSLSTLTAGYKLSVYVPTPTMEFKPFSNSVADQCQPGTTPGIEAIPGGNLPVTFDPLPLTAPRNTHKKIDTGIINAKVAGTYVVRAKFLPYIDMLLENSDGDVVDVRGSSESMASITGTTGATGDITYAFISGHTEYARPNPTETNYLQSKAAPTRSVNFKLVWKIQVTWTVRSADGTDIQIYPQTYQYKCNGVRTYYGANMESVTLSPLLPVPEQPQPGGE